MSLSQGSCAFCGAAVQLVPTCVLDEKWSSRFGGYPVVALDHGWYESQGRRVPADEPSAEKFFGPHVRALCDFCAHGWAEDVRWRAEPALLALAERREMPPAPRQGMAPLVRWAQMTAMLAELLEGMPTASTPAQRDAVRRGTAPSPEMPTWFFACAQRLPARVHLSQVALNGPDDPPRLIQIVSIELAHLAVVVVLPSDEQAAAVIDQSALRVELGPPTSVETDVAASVRRLDLARTPHPHRIAVQRLCATSSASQH
jgi:hypothetical protein